MFDRISSFAGSLQRGYQIQSMQSQLNQLTKELTTGLKSDPAGAMGNRAALLYQLHTQAAQQTTLQTSITMASQRLDTAQTVMTSIGDIGQTVANSTLEIASGTGTMSNSTLSVLASQARGAMGQVLGYLNTTYAGAAVFAGDQATPPMAAAGATGGPLAAVNSVLDAAVSAKGGALSQSDVDALLNSTDGLSSVFDDTHSDPALRYSGAFYIAADDGKPTKVLVGNSQTLQYDLKGNQPAFRDLLKGLSVLSMLDAPSSQLDDSAKSELLTQAYGILGKAQNELTTQQGSLGSVQSQLESIVDLQQSAANATQQQILSYEQADTFGDATKLSMLQTQLQATYALTAQISQLSLVHYMASGG